jgi:transcriptional regulator with XRE-family HTH domain
MSKKKNAANQIDAHVGSRVRSRRVLLGLSQEKLGDALGLTFQQIQKYERGANRIGASRLFDLSCALDVPVSYFFDGIPPEIVPARSGTIEAKPASARKNMLEPDILLNRETTELVRAYYAVSDGEVRRRTIEFLRVLGERVGTEDKDGTPSEG